MGGAEAIPTGPTLDPQALIAALRQAESRDEVVQYLLRGMESVARGVGVLALRKNLFAGCSCNAQMADVASFQSLQLGAHQPSVFKAAVERGWYLGPLTSTPGTRPLLDILSGPVREIYAVSVIVSQRPILVLLATDLTDTLTATRTAGALAGAASEALTRIIKAEKHSR
jgi:hypothetical protein